MLKIIVQNYCSIKVSHIMALENGEVLFDSLKRKFTYNNPDYIEAKKWGRSLYKLEPHIFTYRVLGDEIQIYRGGLNKITKFFDINHIEYQIVDYTLVLPQTTFFKKAKYNLRQDQIDFKNALLVNPNPTVGFIQGIGLGNPSFGKTFTSINLIQELGQPALILVHTKFLQQQWIKAMIEDFGMSKEDIGGAGGVFAGKPKVRKINVALYHSMSKREINVHFKDHIGILIVDEVQKASIKQFIDSINPFRARYRYGVSASIDRKDGKKFIILDLMGEVKFIAKVDETVESNSQISCRIFGTRTGVRPTEEFNSSILSELADVEERNIRIARSAVREVRQGKIVIIFVERKKQAGILAKLLSKFRTYLLIGAVNPKELKKLDIPDKAKKILENNEPELAFDEVNELALKKELDIIIATQKGEVGLSIETLNHGIVTTPVGNNIERFNQLKGRIERKHKDKRLELFGEKPIPTLEVMVDDWDSSYNAWTLIKENYKDLIIKNPYLIKKD